MNNKRITKTGSLIIVVLELAVFALTWTLDYNDKAFRTNRTIGLLMCLIVWLVVFMWLCGLYKAFAIASTSVGETVFSQFISFGIADLILYFVCILLNRNYVNIWFGVLCVLIQLGISICGVIFTKRILMDRIVPEKTIILYGENYSFEKANQFAERLLAKYSHIFEVGEVLEDKLGDDELFGKLEGYQKIIMLGVEYHNRNTITKYCIEHNKQFLFVPELEEIIYMNCETKHLLDTPLKQFTFSNESREYRFAKRSIDFILAFALLLILSPLMLIVSILIKLEDGGPVIFKQLRVTKNERTFYIYKFRSMVVDADNVEKYGLRPTTDDDPRITRIGKWMRSLRIDELPQLVNILIGDMAFVGPRPERVEHVQKYETDLPEFRYRHAVRGGLTGYAQVYGKYNTSPEDKLKLDLLYIMNQSLFTDAKIFLLTFRTLFQKESTEGFGISQFVEMNEMMERLKGM